MSHPTLIPIASKNFVEQDILGNQTTFGPDEVAGATRIDLGSIASGASKSVQVLLAVRSDDVSPNQVASTSCIRITPGAGSDPVIFVDKGACGSPSASATAWNVVAGNLSGLVETGGIVTLGPVECIASKILVDRVTEVHATDEVSSNLAHPCRPSDAWRGPTGVSLCAAGIKRALAMLACPAARTPSSRR